MRQLGRGTRMVATMGVAALVGLAACGGGSDDAEETAESIVARAAKTAQSASDSAADDTVDGSARSGSATTDVAEPIKVQLGKTGWHDGFAVTVEGLTAEPGFVGASLTIDVTYQNLGDETAQPSQGVVEVDGESLSAFWDTPQVPGLGKAKGTIQADVEGEIASQADLEKVLGSAAVVFGEARDNQTRIPLDKAGKVDSVEPKKLTVTGTLTHGQLVVDVLDGTLQPSYESGEKGKAELSLHIKISCTPDCQASGYNVDRSMFSVKGPDGTSAVADSRSRYCCDAIYPGDVSDNADNVLTFVVPSPGTGAYTLTFENPSASSTGIAAPTLAITA